jgi:putative mRNA 3-end processing factor
MTQLDDRSLFEFHDGLHLRETVLWFDAPKARQLCFVSHANVASALAHQKILTTDRTAELLRALAAVHGRGRRAHQPQALVTPYGRGFSLGQLSLELFPSGHVLGSASLLLQHRGLTIVYAGEVNPRRSLLAERLEARHCDVLALPCRFAQRRDVFPPFDQVAAAIVRFASDSLERRCTPIFFCPPLGEAQEVARLLLEAGIAVRAHRQIVAVAQVYERAGLLAGVRRYQEIGREPAALLWPLALRRSPTLSRLPDQRTALVSGSALDEETRDGLGCDAAFALSTHADYAGLLEYIRACKPEQVILTEGATGELRRDLQALGMRVHAVGPPHQLDLLD